MAVIHEHMLKMLRPPLSPAKHAIMERMCKICDDQGMVHMTAKEILTPIKAIDKPAKYQFWVELVRNQKLITHVLGTDKTIEVLWNRDVGNKVHYRVSFPSIAGSPSSYAMCLRTKLRNAMTMFGQILEISKSDPGLTHKSAEELLAECAAIAKRGFEQSRYQKDELIKYLEILKNGGQIPRPVDGDQEDADGRKGDAPRV